MFCPRLKKLNATNASNHLLNWPRPEFFATLPKRRFLWQLLNLFDRGLTACFFILLCSLISPSERFFASKNLTWISICSRMNIAAVLIWGSRPSVKMTGKARIRPYTTSRQIYNCGWWSYWRIISYHQLTITNCFQGQEKRLCTYSQNANKSPWM